MSEDFNTLEICYLGMINSDTDKSVTSTIQSFLNQSEDLQYNWYFSEASISEPFHRVIGWDLSRGLDSFELVKLHLLLQEKYSGNVFVIGT